jgi:hypothetical protein
MAKAYNKREAENHFSFYPNTITKKHPDETAGVPYMRNIFFYLLPVAAYCIQLWRVPQFLKSLSIIM